MRSTRYRSCECAGASRSTVVDYQTIPGDLDKCPDGEGFGYLTQVMHEQGRQVAVADVSRGHDQEQARTSSKSVRISEVSPSTRQSSHRRRQHV